MIAENKLRLSLPGNLLLLIVFFSVSVLTCGSVYSQEHDFTNPKVRVEVTSDYLIVQTSGFPDHRWEKVNPNTPSRQNFTFKIPRHPRAATLTSKSPLRGPVAVAVNGVVFFGPEDEFGQIAIENHGLDSCNGHPTRRGVYHYHSTPKCVHKDGAGKHSPVIGYAFDGFKIYGKKSFRGQTPGNLDKCNGHLDPKRGYHYHTSSGFPFVLGCYRGTPVTSNYDRSQQPGNLEREGPGRQEGGRAAGGGPREACETDRKKYCPSMPPSRAFHECMRKNHRSFSQTCQEALRRNRPPR